MAMNRPGAAILVTTSLRAGAGQRELAERIGGETGLPLVNRANYSLAELLQMCNAYGAIVVETTRVYYTDGDVEFFFHPGLAGLRITEIRRGKNDQMIAAMDLKPGQRILDCTLGLGNDALVAGYVVGENGLVVGLESSPVVASLVRYGMQNYNRGARLMREIMRRIEVRCADHREVLVQLPADSFDVVYLDPMFQKPLVKSSGINALRPLADYRKLTPQVIQLALRVAKKRVVVKDNRVGSELGRLGITRITGGKNAHTVFGILSKGD